MTLSVIIQEAKKRFPGVFEEKLFLEQLQYFGDIEDFTVELVGRKTPKGAIQEFLKTQVEEFVEKKLKR
jgi:hypothetical protein